MPAPSKGPIARRSRVDRTVQLNAAKSDQAVLGRPEGNSNVKENFEYLGYRYTISLAHAPRRPRKLQVTIAEKKIKKIKTRLLLAAMAFSKDGDYPLFHSRIQYLTGNYKFMKRRPIASTGKSMVRSGIFYNYRYCGEYQGDTRSTHPMPELRQLDWFFQNSILGSRYPIGRSLCNKLSPNQLASLRRLSFAQGHMQIFATGFNSDKVKKIKKIWNNV